MMGTILRSFWTIALLIALAIPSLSAAEEDEEGEATSRILRVGTSGDYAPFSLDVGEPGSPVYQGFDIRLAEAYAADRGLEIEWVRFRWPTLLRDLEAERFDLAMSGVTLRPDRSAVGRFSVAVVETGAVALVLALERWLDAEGLNNPIARIAVNAGGHLERVTRRKFPLATLIAIPDNAAVAQALRDEVVDAAVSDSLEAPIWRGDNPEISVLGPFTRDRKAYLIHRDRTELAADLDAWLLAAEEDGSLAALRLEMLGDIMTPVATPLGALLAAVDERLAMMPMVGAAKRDQGIPLEVPERESVVLDAAVASVRSAAESRDSEPRDSEPPPDAAVRALFRAQMDAAKRVQWKAVQEDEPPEALPDVDDVLRPALIRIGDRIAALLLDLPAGLDPATVRAAARKELRAPYLEPTSIDAIADAITAVSASRVPAPATQPLEAQAAP